MRAIKQRIRSVHSTQQITNAMKLVAASKLQKAKSRAEATRPFFNELQRVISNTAKSSKGIKHVFLDGREVKNVLVILITSNRGLCGGYNSNICKEATAIINEKPNAKLVVIGNKGKDYFSRRGKNIVKAINTITQSPNFQDAKAIGDFAVEQFKSGEVDEVYLAFTRFNSTISHTPQAIRILPLDKGSLVSSQQVEESKVSGIMGYEPDEEYVLNKLVPWYINSTIFSALTESIACEEGARMTSMDSATENATEMINTLTLKYNRARQGAITQEITEIVSGANASS